MLAFHNKNKNILGHHHRFILACISLWIIPLYSMEAARVQNTLSKDDVTKYAANICSAVRDPYEALSQIDALVSGHIELSAQADMLHNLLIVPAFVQHIDVILQRIKEIYDRTIPSTLDNDLRLIQRMLCKFSQGMRTFVCDRFRVRFDWNGLKQHPLSRFEHFYYSKGERASFPTTNQDVSRPRIFLKYNNYLLSYIPSFKSRPVNSYAYSVRRSENQKETVFRIMQGEAVIKEAKFKKPIFPELEKFSHNKRILVIGVVNNTAKTSSNSDTEDSTDVRILHIYGANIFDNTQYPFIELYKKKFEKTHNSWTRVFSADEKLSDLSIRKITFSHNDRYIFVSTNFGYILKKINTEIPIIEKLDKNSCRYASCAFTHDDRLLLTASEVENRSQAITVFDICLAQVLHVLRFDREQPFLSIKFSDDDRLLVLGQSNSVTILQKNIFEGTFFIKAASNLRQPVRIKGVKAVTRAAMLGNSRIRSLLVNNSTTALLARSAQLRASSSAQENPAEPSQAAVIECNPRSVSPDTFGLCASDGTFTCLALDGEGMHVLMTIALLEKMEQRLGAPIHTFFDCIVGSSFAAIVALDLVLASRFSRLNKLADFFCKHGNDIFPVRGKAKQEPYYAKSELRNLLVRHFKDHALSDASFRVLVPCREAVSQARKIFDSAEAQRNEENDFYLFDVAYAGSADSAFFAPMATHNIPNTENSNYMASNTFKNNAAQLLQSILPTQRRILFLNVASCIDSEENLSTHSELAAKKQPGNMDSANRAGFQYLRLKPSIQLRDVSRCDDTHPNLLHLYRIQAASGIDERVINDFVEFLKSSRGMRR